MNGGSQHWHSGAERQKLGREAVARCYLNGRPLMRSRLGRRTSASKAEAAAPTSREMLNEDVECLRPAVDRLAAKRCPISPDHISHRKFPFIAQHLDR